MNFARAKHCGQQVKPLLGIPATLLSNSLMHPGRQWMTAQVLGTLSPMWENRMKFQTPGFCLVQPWLLQHLEVNQPMEDFLSLSLK